MILPFVGLTDGRSSSHEHSEEEDDDEEEDDEDEDDEEEEEDDELSSQLRLCPQPLCPFTSLNPFRIMDRMIRKCKNTKVPIFDAKS